MTTDPNDFRRMELAHDRLTPEDYRWDDDEEPKRPKSWPFLEGREEYEDL